MKIAYEACCKGISISELFINAILRTYKKLHYNEIKEQLMTPKNTEGSFEIYHQDLDIDNEDDLIYKDSNANNNDNEAKKTKTQMPLKNSSNKDLKL